jgi:putative nucleotidyltransferase with HDIG domain
MDTERPLVDLLEEFLDRNDPRLAVFPGIASGISRERTRDTPDKSRLIHLMIHDPSLTGTILHRANTAMFTGLRPITNVYDALDRLGFDPVLSLVGESVRKGEKLRTPIFQELLVKLWQHSVGTAIGAHWLAQRCGFHRLMHEAFAAGLLHDIGKLLVLTSLDRACETSAAYAALGREVCMDFLESLHTEYGARLLTRWGLPEEIRQLSAEHHQDLFDFNNSLAALVRLTNQACHKLGIGLYPPVSSNLASTPEAYSLGLSEIALAELEIALEDSPLLGHRSV